MTAQGFAPMIPADWRLEYTESTRWYRTHAEAWRAFCDAPKGWAQFHGPIPAGGYVVTWRVYEPVDVT